MPGKNVDIYYILTKMKIFKKIQILLTHFPLFISSWSFFWHKYVQIPCKIPGGGVKNFNYSSPPLFRKSLYFSGIPNILFQTTASKQTYQQFKAILKKNKDKSVVLYQSKVNWRSTVVNWTHHSTLINGHLKLCLQFV